MVGLVEPIRPVSNHAHPESQRGMWWSEARIGWMLVGDVHMVLSTDLRGLVIVFQGEHGRDQ